MLTIDLRTASEQGEHPAPSDITIEVPPPPLDVKTIAWVAETLLHITQSVPKDEIIKVFCARGHRSALAAAILKQAGYTVIDAGGTHHG